VVAVLLLGRAGTAGTVRRRARRAGAAAPSARAAAAAQVRGSRASTAGRHRRLAAVGLLAEIVHGSGPAVSIKTFPLLGEDAGRAGEFRDVAIDNAPSSACSR
jgi:hypothetical protein